MVPYAEVQLQPGKRYSISMEPTYRGSVRYFERTRANALSMHREGRPVSIIVPSRSITPEEKEQYRAFFCTHAKKVRRNCIYFEGPVSVRET